MEVSQGDLRRFGLTLASVFILATFILGVGFVIRLKTPFEQEQARAEAGIPKWLSVKITTADSRLEYHESEPIVLIARFSSRARYMYKVEAAEGLSKAAIDLLHISNGQRIPLNRVVIVCCDSRLIGLDVEPYIPPTRTPLKLTAGEYEIYLSSRRVFKWDAAAKEYNPSSFEVASNLLKIRVLPDSVVDRRLHELPEIISVRDTHACQLLIFLDGCRSRANQSALVLGIRRACVSCMYGACQWIAINCCLHSAYVIPTL
jgi:hypothetical protein